jgi:hypothetical protein
MTNGLVSEQGIDFAALMRAVLDAPSNERTSRFLTLRAAFADYLLELRQADGPGWAQFVASSETYLRALSTYPASSEEWLDVFRAFKQLYERHHPTSVKTPPRMGAAPARTFPN